MKTPTSLVCKIRLAGTACALTLAATLACLLLAGCTQPASSSAAGSSSSSPASSSSSDTSSSTDSSGSEDSMGKQEDEFGSLKEARYSNSGNSLGNMYYIETAYDDDGTFIVREADSPTHNERAIIREYRAPADLLDRIDAIVDKSGMKTWGDLPLSEYVLLDASTPTISLTYDSADPDDGFPIWISYTTNVVFPEGGEEAFYAIRDELSACATDENLIREYREAEREP